MTETPFIRGKCSSCGGRAQKRRENDAWFHVDVYNDYSIHRSVNCAKPSPDAAFIQERSRSRRTRFTTVEPHYREVVTEVMDYSNVDADGNPDPVLKKYRQPILCTCTNPACPGWGVELPDEIRRARQDD